MAAQLQSRSLRVFRDLRRATSHLRSFGTPAEAPVVAAAVFDIDGTVILRDGSVAEHGRSLCDMAEGAGCSIHYITARMAPTNGLTVRQLRKAGLPVKDTTLQSRPVDACSPVEDIKYEQRKRVSSRVHTGRKKSKERAAAPPVWLNVGDSINDVITPWGISRLAVDMGLTSEDVVHLLRHTDGGILVLHGYDDSSWVSILVPPEKGDERRCSCHLCSSVAPTLWS